MLAVTNATDLILLSGSLTGYGAQTASAERPTNENYGCHIHLLQRNIWLLENVVDMSELPPGGGGILNFQLYTHYLLYFNREFIRDCL